MVITKAITAQNQWSDPFELRGDSHNRGLLSRALVLCSTGANTVTLQRLAGDKSTVTAALELGSVMEAVEVPVTGWYRIGVATGDFVSNETLTVEQ